jgi:CHAT domain-containing protein
MRRTTRACAAAAAAIVLAGVRPGPGLSARVQDASVLSVDTPPTTRELCPREEHRYAVALNSGESAVVLIEHQGVDVVARVADASDGEVAEIQDEIARDGREVVEWVADHDGLYTVSVRSERGSTSPGRYAVRLASRRIATPGDRAVDAARRLQSAAARLETLGRFADARVQLERAQTAAESAWGTADVRVARLLLQLAGVYRRLANETESESLYRRAIGILDSTLGADDPRTAVARAEFAVLYERQGDRRTAEGLLRQAIDVIGRRLGPTHPSYVSCLVTLGNLRDGAGDLGEEQAIVERALAISEETGDTGSLQYAALLNNLGEVYRQKQQYGHAEALFERALTLQDSLLGPDNYAAATALQNLGIVARERKDYAAAIAYNMRALVIRERTVGPDHPDVARILTNLANIYRATGDYTRALDTHFRALHIWETSDGPYQQATLLSVGNIAKTYAALGETANALPFERRADAIVEAQLALNLAVGSERQKQAFVASIAERTDRTISLHLDRARGDAGASALAALVILQRKGRVLDAMLDTFATVRERIADPDDRRLLDDLNVTTTRLARTALRPNYSAHDEERQRTIRDLDARKESLEAELAEHSAEFRAQLRPITLEAVQAAIPEDAALLEFAVYRPFDPRAARNAEAYGRPHYAAYVLRRHPAAAGVDLGPVVPIDRAVADLRRALRDPRADARGAGRALDDLVLRPLATAIGDARRLLISPDGQLNLVPFEALVDGAGRYGVQRYAVSYLTSGRDLLRMQVRRDPGGIPVIFADPLFGEPSSIVATQPENTGSGHAHRSTTTDDLASMYFAPLPGTADEARSIRSLFPGALLFTGSRATKTALRRVEAPRMLHIASHAFFLQDADPILQNPLLRSGLALAGANTARESRARGVLTALEASGLNLWGTRLVTLSACDTGIGEVRNGEGVYGLRRAFVLAGAETVVMSLWPVSDYIARETMVAYYRGLRAGLGRGDALRHAKLAMLARPGRQHPYYWATFIQSGEWANLDGER